jgi:hypothetical protein
VHIRNETTGQVYGDWIAIDAIELELTIRMPIQIDIKPGSTLNSINPGSNGVIPVAVLTTGAFDAATVNPETIRFGVIGNGAAPMFAALEDVNEDGHIDLILHFKTQDSGIRCGDVSAWLTGETFAGKLFHGTGWIKTAGCKTFNCLK